MVLIQHEDLIPSNNQNSEFQFKLGLSIPQLGLAPDSLMVSFFLSITSLVSA